MLLAPPVWWAYRSFNRNSTSVRNLTPGGEANAAADFLAKMKIPGKDVILWPSEFPAKLREIIQDVARGRIYCVKPKKAKRNRK